MPEKTRILKAHSHNFTLISIIQFIWITRLLPVMMVMAMTMMVG